MRACVCDVIVHYVSSSRPLSTMPITVQLGTCKYSNDPRDIRHSIETTFDSGVLHTAHYLTRPRGLNYIDYQCM